MFAARDGGCSLHNTKRGLRCGRSYAAGWVSFRSRCDIGFIGTGDCHYSGLAWVLKRMKVPSLVNQQGLKIVRQIPVGTKERIAIVQAGEEQFLVGITAQSIQLISKLEQPLDENEVSQPAFASQLSKIMKKQQND